MLEFSSASEEFMATRNPVDEIFPDLLISAAQKQSEIVFFNS